MAICEMNQKKQKKMKSSWTSPPSPYTCRQRRSTCRIHAAPEKGREKSEAEPSHARYAAAVGRWPYTWPSTGSGWWGGGIAHMSSVGAAARGALHTSSTSHRVLRSHRCCPHMTTCHPTPVRMNTPPSGHREHRSERERERCAARVRGERERSD